jgi:hypothetical protein
MGEQTSNTDKFGEKNENRDIGSTNYAMVLKYISRMDIYQVFVYFKKNVPEKKKTQQTPEPTHLFLARFRVA